MIFGYSTQTPGVKVQMEIGGDGKLGIRDICPGRPLAAAAEALAELSQDRSADECQGLGAGGVTWR